MLFRRYCHDFDPIIGKFGKQHRPFHLWIRTLDEKGSSFNPSGGAPKPCLSLQTTRYISRWGPSREEFIVEFKKLFAAVKKIDAATPDWVVSGGKPDPVNLIPYFQTCTWLHTNTLSPSLKMEKTDFRFPTANYRKPLTLSRLNFVNCK